MKISFWLFIAWVLLVCSISAIYGYNRALVDFKAGIEEGKRQQLVQDEYLYEKIKLLDKKILWEKSY